MENMQHVASGPDPIFPYFVSPPAPRGLRIRFHSSRHDSERKEAAGPRTLVRGPFYWTQKRFALSRSSRAWFDALEIPARHRDMPDHLLRKFAIRRMARLRSFSEPKNYCSPGVFK